MKRIEIENAWQGAKDCQNCSIRTSALFADLNQEDFANIHAPIDDLHFSIGGYVYRQSSKADYIFTLRKGFIKLLLLNADGTERIVRIIKQGDLFGMESLTEALYHHSAIALEPIEVCRIPA